MKDEIIKLFLGEHRKSHFLAWPCCFLPGWLLRSVPASSSVTCRFLLAGSLAKQLVCTISLTPQRRVRRDVLGFAIPSG